MTVRIDLNGLLAAAVGADGLTADDLAGLAAVDHLIVFDDDTPRALIAALGPDVLVKGADWAEGDIIGRDETLARGGRVERIDFVPDVSTSDIIRRIRGG